MSAAPDDLWQVRRMRSQDVAAVLEIERSSYSHPWSERIFHDCLRVGYRAWVVDRAGRSVAGYALASIAVGEAHLLNLCVAESARGHGAAGRLLDVVIARAAAENANELFLEVRPSNRAARRLYARYGFETRGRRPNYYPHRHGREDALVLSKVITI
ncbi:ribosomal protein S18-alanine N-acetyltransferase [Salinisphaera sp. LB1]|uniref:ribosomal protein S18-alanine N-acetyltransferase n=1 Tax=Salinisphaera sp. LB1 TaxID=2183911 RepID=UPI000D7079A5|nr:ribosomal protein S18-alanine N-acetyltransferase [Salinisphaera sp. LB1]AWN16875.1 Ribosomal-protein-S18p-alanine acetyltransferase [Salinisphaera sp. LB1]